jgi:hypothetical protein
LVARWVRLAIAIVAGAVALIVLIDAVRRVQGALRVLADSSTSFPERVLRHAEYSALYVMGLAIGSVATLLLVASVSLLKSAIRAGRCERSDIRQADQTFGSSVPAARAAERRR